MFSFRPRLIIGATRGGSGKTILSLGLLAAWKGQGLRVAPFKKGPDFIDSGWLSFAADRSCYNLDPFMMNQDRILDSFMQHSMGADISLIEGNRGLYDGMDVAGGCSTAELAKLLKAPVVLVMDVTMATRTVAAMVKGCQVFDPDVSVAGVILNRVAGTRQESLIRNTIERYCGIPVVGAVPRLRENPFPERHMGLVPYQERDQAQRAVDWAMRMVQDNLQMDEIDRIAHGVPALDLRQGMEPHGSMVSVPDRAPRIGVVKDRAFWFYYPENLEQLKDLGAELVEVDTLVRREMPLVDALYIGGGFPETQAERLAANRSFRDSLKEAIDKGLPVYAECGGLMYLGQSLLINGGKYPMVGSLPLECALEARPQGHGYTVLKVDGENPYYPVGETVNGHEFHYSRAMLHCDQDVRTVFQVIRGHGLDGKRDGVCVRNLLAVYTHIHAAGFPQWAVSLFRAAQGHIG